ncbi:hypothetical protein EDD17DRAFT_1637570 [Pisolithus thermaeus]|nr:hypothetical protein EV401DRAFT_1930227 [Pisolithus croceorrhizus]KAI6151329.1 hypothetical protein EDD17DRAFT_1637570 [Pisolithus thermaeus]
MSENHRIDIDEEEVMMMEEEEEEEEEDDEETTRRMLIMHQVQNYRMAAAFISLAMAAIAMIQDTSSEESDDESSSFYSSVVTPDESCEDPEPAPQTGDTYNILIQRVHLWRDAVAKDASSSRSLPLKRKLDSYRDDDNNSSRPPSKRPCTTSRSSGYLCSACDTPFPSQQSLHQHARIPHAHGACEAAVGYHFE